jgi:hypothetical protein
MTSKYGPSSTELAYEVNTARKKNPQQHYSDNRLGTFGKN